MIKTDSIVDPVTLAVLRGRLEQIADEMDATLFRSAFNPIIAEAHDASHGLYDAVSGDTLVQGKSGLPIFVGVMAFAVRAVIKKAADNGGPQQGDTWIFNDPYDGGTHLSDFRLVRPVFRSSSKASQQLASNSETTSADEASADVFCYLASVGHWHDVGGNVPGNYNPAATECFQEGMLIPPVRLFRHGELQQDIVDILSANSRLPNSLYGDLNGQINALDLGERRLHELLDEYGDEIVAAALIELRERAANLMQARISALPNGTVSSEDYLDNDGIIDEPLKVALDLTVKNDRLVMDFSRSSPACAGPVNISYSTTIAACYVALKHVFEDVPANAGVLEPVEFIVPEDSLLAVTAPKPVGGYTETILRLIDVVFLAISQLEPARATACAYGTINALALNGHRANGQRWVMFSFFGGGHGAHANGDGLNHGNAPISTATIPPLEILEAAYPVMFRQWSLRPDSGGDGKYRGGLGAVYEIELLEEFAQGFLFGERGKYPPQGVVAGGSAACNAFSYEQDDGIATPPMVSKLTGMALRKGQAVKLETPGGGGYGDPAERPQELRERDAALGYVNDNASTNPSAIAGKPEQSL